MLIVVGGAPVFRDFVALHSEHRINLLTDMVIRTPDQPLSAVRFAYLRLIHEDDNIFGAVRCEEAKIRSVYRKLNVKHVQQIVITRDKR